MNDCMIDLETFGTLPGSIVRSVGAVMFDAGSDAMGSKFYRNITHVSSHEAGMTMDLGTLDWWAKQGTEAKESLLLKPVSLETAVRDFTRWFNKNAGFFVWSQGSNFDEVLWSAACRAVGATPPWKFYNSRDTRTAYAMAGLNYHAIKRIGTYHNALDDAEHQAKCVQIAHKRLRRGK
jgi:hypothetical protein